MRILVLSLGSTAILLTITAMLAAGVSRISLSSPVPLLQAYSPDGLAEISLVALSLSIGVAFVAAHHIIRVFIVMIGAAQAFALL
jgi:uncharacterized membrane protein AbrB (regulator of aidB expression)